MASLFYRNNGDGTFTERGVEAGVAYTEDGLEQAGMGVSADDYDGDGFLDIFKTNFDEDVPDLYHNEGAGTFTFRTFDAKLAFHLNKLSWGGGFFDYDNDGCPDLFIANGHVYPELESHGHSESPYRQQNTLYHNLCHGTFQESSSVAGPGFELRHSGRGAAFLDYDNDGALDIAVNNQNDPPTLLRNVGKNANHWITIRTVGTRSNRDGIGARVTVTAGRRWVGARAWPAIRTELTGRITILDRRACNPLAQRHHGQTGESDGRQVPDSSGRKRASRNEVVTELISWRGADVQSGESSLFSQARCVVPAGNSTFFLALSRERRPPATAGRGSHQHGGFSRLPDRGADQWAGRL